MSIAKAFVSCDKEAIVDYVSEDYRLFESRLYWAGTNTYGGWHQCTCKEMLIPTPDVEVRRIQGLTLEQAKSLQRGDWLVDIVSGKRWKVNGKPRVWVRDPSRIGVPIKHGLYTYTTLIASDINTMRLE